MRNNKKASIQDVLMLGVIVLVAGIMILIGFKIGSVFNQEVQTDPIFTTEGREASSQLLSYYPTIIDNTFLFLVIGVGISTLLMAALVKVHPIFIVFFIIGLIFIVFLSAVFSNIYTSMASSTELSAEANQLHNISFIIKRLPFIIGIFGSLLMIVMHKIGE